MDSASTVELASKHFVSLNETLKFTSKVSILTLETLCVLLEGITLGKHVSIVGFVLRVSNTKALDITTQSEQSVFLFFEAEL